MKMPELLNRYLLIRPTIRMIIEWPILLLIGVLGELLSWAKLPFFPFSNAVGGIIFVAALVLHAHCHQLHEQAHEQSGEIEKLVTTGIFTKIRHPMYLSLVLMYLGAAIAWGVVWMLIPALLFSAVTVLVAIKEESFLKNQFGPEYVEYLQKVPWRFIPGVF
jgi:protein-S-isoprenylcysteine O-methyltransferase Ste14